MQRKKCFPHLLLLLGYSPRTPQPPLAPTPCTSSPGGLGLRRSSFTQGWAFRANGAFYAIFLIKNPQKLRGAVRPCTTWRWRCEDRTAGWGVAAAGPMRPSGAGPCVPGLWGGCGVVVGSHTTHQGQAGGLEGAALEQMGMGPGLQELSTPHHGRAITPLPCPSPKGDPRAGGSACPGGGPLPVGWRGAAWEAAGSSPYRTPPFPQQP